MRRSSPLPGPCVAKQATRGLRSGGFESLRSGMIRDESMRIAYFGPAPAPASGVQHVGWQLVGELARHAEVHLYLSADDEMTEAVRSLPAIASVSSEASRFEWDRWYSRTGSTAFITGQLARARSQHRVLQRLVRDHRQRPFDVVWQFSQTELFGLRRVQGTLPPIVVHPETHAAGELRWLWRERDLDVDRAMRVQRLAGAGIMAGRSAVQRLDTARVAGIIAPSRAFASELGRDYRIPPEKLAVVPNPVDLERFRPSGVVAAGPPIRLLFVSRLAVRKGLDLVVDLSRRLDDLAGEVTIELIGDRTLWSDYRPLLAGLNDRIATPVGHKTSEEMVAALRSADGLLQPSKYEPFGITVTEALASGVPVVASDVVGAAEGLPDDVCRVFPAGDARAFEREVRRLVSDVTEHRDDLRSACREAAERFGPVPVTETLLEALQDFARSPRGDRYATTARSYAAS